MSDGGTHQPGWLSGDSAAPPQGYAVEFGTGRLVPVQYFTAPKGRQTVRVSGG